MSGEEEESVNVMEEKLTSLDIANTPEGVSEREAVCLITESDPTTLNPLMGGITLDVLSAACSPSVSCIVIVEEEYWQRGEIV